MAFFFLKDPIICVMQFSRTHLLHKISKITSYTLYNKYQKKPVPEWINVEEILAKKPLA